MLNILLLIYQCFCLLNYTNYLLQKFHLMELVMFCLKSIDFKSLNILSEVTLDPVKLSYQKIRTIAADQYVMYLQV